MLFLSLGAGVQSSTLLMLAIAGEIECPEHVIFADTGLEPRAVYVHVEWCAKQAINAGIGFHVVQAGSNIREQIESFERDESKHINARPPFYFDGSGPVRRQCTRDAKIKPIHAKQIELMGFRSARGIPDGCAITQIGISTDEARRASPSQTRWIELDFPLVDPLRWSRGDCQAWWDAYYHDVPLPSSSCIICPYKTENMWGRLKRMQPEDFADACDLDDRIRAAYFRRTGQSPFIYRGLKPLREASFDTDQETLDFDDAIYCAGGCGL